MFYGQLSQAPDLVLNESRSHEDAAPGIAPGTPSLYGICLTLLRVGQYRHTGHPGMLNGRHHLRDRPVGNSLVRAQVQ